MRRLRLQYWDDDSLKRMGVTVVAMVVITEGLANSEGGLRCAEEID